MCKPRRALQYKSGSIDDAVQKRCWAEFQLRKDSSTPSFSLRIFDCNRSIVTAKIPRGELWLLHLTMGVGNLLFLLAALLRVARPGNYVLIIDNGNKLLQLLFLRRISARFILVSLAPAAILPYYLPIQICWLAAATLTRISSVTVFARQ